jgi:hypothetical protein
MHEGVNAQKGKVWTRLKSDKAVKKEMALELAATSMRERANAGPRWMSRRTCRGWRFIMEFAEGVPGCGERLAGT